MSELIINFLHLQEQVDYLHFMHDTPYWKQLRDRGLTFFPPLPAPTLIAKRTKQKSFIYTAYGNLFQLTRNDFKYRKHCPSLLVSVCLKWKHSSPTCIKDTYMLWDKSSFVAQM